MIPVVIVNAYGTLGSVPLINADPFANSNEQLTYEDSPTVNLLYFNASVRAVLSASVVWKYSNNFHSFVVTSTVTVGRLTKPVYSVVCTVAVCEPVIATVVVVFGMVGSALTSGMIFSSCLDVWVTVAGYDNDVTTSILPGSTVAGVVVLSIDPLVTVMTLLSVSVDPFFDTVVTSPLVALVKPGPYFNGFSKNGSMSVLSTVHSLICSAASLTIFEQVILTLSPSVRVKSTLNLSDAVVISLSDSINSKVYDDELTVYVVVLS